ncbi:MAG: OstA-like protein, partial [Parafilimonas sp.]
MNTRKASSFFFIFIFLLASTFAIAQQPAATDTPHSKKQIYILNAKRLNYEKKDSAEYQSAAGNVIIKQDSTLFYSDSVVINKTRNMLEAFGHVHINDADSVHTYSDYLRYIGNEKKAFLKDNVRLTDGRATLTTPELEYDVNTKIGTYIKGGKVVNGSTVLTSNEGYYYGETRDIYFKKNVLLVSPDYNVKTDTLLYNTYTDVATFIVPTEITSGKNRKILTSDGYYDLRNKKYYFGKRPQIQDSSTFLIADEVAHEDSSGFGEARGNVIYRDTSQGVTILTNNLKNNSKTNSFLATQKPVMILKQDKDSIYIAADTFYSAKLTELIKTRYVPVIDDSLAQQQQQYTQRRMLSKPSSPTELFPALADSLHQQYTDTSSSFASQLNQVAGIDSLLPAEDTSLITESSDSSVKSLQSASSQISDSSLTSSQLS